MSSIDKLSTRVLGLVCGSALFLSDAVLLAQPGPDEWSHAIHYGLTRERVIGLVDVPELVGEGRNFDVPVATKLYGTRSEAKPPIGVMEVEIADVETSRLSCGSHTVVLRRANTRTTECMPMSESGYEIQAAIVYERTGPWVRIALQRGSAWMKSGNPEHFHEYPKMLVDNLTYIPDGWDGRLWRTPGESPAGAVSPKVKALLKAVEGRNDGVAVDVLAVRRIRGGAWIQVRVVDGHCDGPGDPVTIDTGWVPAYRATRGPAVWFYSRGC
jgi:hypothetical protein